MWDISIKTLYMLQALFADLTPLIKYTMHLLLLILQISENFWFQITALFCSQLCIVFQFFVFYHIAFVIGQLTRLDMCSFLGTVNVYGLPIDTLIAISDAMVITITPPTLWTEPSQSVICYRRTCLITRTCYIKSFK